MSRFSDPVLSILNDLHRNNVLTEWKSEILLLDSTGAAPPSLDTPDILMVSR